MALDATAGSPNATSYVTVARASLLLQARLHTEPWFGALDAPVLTLALLEQARPAALCWATRLLDEQVAWHGQPLTLTQALAFPMTGLTDRYGRVVPSDSIPLVIEQATALYALWLLRDQREALGLATTANIKSKKLGDTTITYQDAPPTGGALEAVVRMPPEVRQMLTPYGQVAGSIMVPLLRG